MRILSCFVLVIMIGCSSNPKGSKNPFDPITLERVLIKDESEMRDVLRELGAPNIIAKSSDGGETWTYSKQFVETEGGYASVGLGLLTMVGGSWMLPGVRVGGDQSSTRSKSLDLVIDFNPAHKLSHYSLVSSQF
jgi:hypothetical protein